MAVAPVVKRPKDVLTASRQRAAYNDAERQFSQLLQQRLQDVLQGKRERLPLLRRYPQDPDRLGIMETPASLVRDDLRLPTVEGMLWDTINFVRLKASGGPIAQQTGSDGSVLELQSFPTKFPHIVLERTDRYHGDAAEPVETTWTLQRLQNQRTQTRINRLFDAANLLFELVRVVR
jgi:hypothetical protein